MSTSLGLGGSSAPTGDTRPTANTAPDSRPSQAGRDSDHRGQRSEPTSSAARDPRDRRPTERRSYDRPSDDRRGAGPRGNDRGPREGGVGSRDGRAPREPEFGSRRRVEDIGEAWPEIPEWATSDELDPEVRRDLRGLSREGADFVAAHLVAASALADEDPELAWRHARAARTRGGRIAVVRETVGLVAYRAGEWAEAIGELRAARRMSGGPGQLAVLADCERALGHPERAIELSRSPEAATLDAEQRVELGIVSAGARADLGQTEAAVAQLEQLAATAGDSPRVAFAYADLLEQVGRREDAIRWFIKAADADLDEETDAAERLQQLGADPVEAVAADDPGTPAAAAAVAALDDDEAVGHDHADVAIEPVADDADENADAQVVSDPSTDTNENAPEAGVVGPQAGRDAGDDEAAVLTDAETADTPAAGGPDVEVAGAGRPPFVEAPTPTAAPVAERADGQQPSDAGDDTPVSSTPAAGPGDAAAAAASETEESTAEGSSDDDGQSGESTAPSFPGAPLFSDNPRTGA